MTKVDGTILQRKTKRIGAGDGDAAHLEQVAAALAKEVAAVFSVALDAKIEARRRAPQTDMFGEILQALDKTLTPYQFSFPTGDDVIIYLDPEAVALAVRWSLDGVVVEAGEGAGESASDDASPEVVLETPDETDAPADKKISITDRRLAKLLAEKFSAGVFGNNQRHGLFTNAAALKFETLAENGEQLDIGDPDVIAHNFMFDLNVRKGGPLGAIGFIATGSLLRPPQQEDAGAKAAAQKAWALKLREQVMGLPIAMNVCLAGETLDVETIGGFAVGQTVPLKGASLSVSALVPAARRMGAPFTTGVVGARNGARIFEAAPAGS
jgi:hypothetical protein